MKISFSFCLILAAMIAVVGCGGGGSDSGGGTTNGNVVTSLVIAAGQQLTVGEQRKLQFTARTGDGTIVTSQIAGLTNWTSTNNGVVSFNKDTATGVSNGTANVTVRYTNQNGSVVSSTPVAVTVGTLNRDPVARVLATVPNTGPYRVTFTPTGGVAATIASNAIVGTFTNFATVGERSGKIRVFENDVQRSSRDVVLEDNQKVSIIIAGTPANTLIVPVVDDTTAVASGQFRLRFVIGYVASGQRFDIYVLQPGQTVNDVAPVKENRGAETGFVEDLPFGANRFAVTAPGSKTVLFTGAFDSPNRSDVSLVFDEVDLDTYRFNFWGSTPP